MRPSAYISTITTPASSYALITLSTLKTLLDIETTRHDAFLNLAIANASAAAIKFMNNPIVVETLSDQIWPWRDSWLGALADRDPSLQLKRWPIVGVASVVETIAGAATALTAGQDYLIDANYGRLVRLDWRGNPRDWSADPVTVAYTAGYASVPADLVDALGEMIKARFYARKRDPAIRSQNVEGVLSTQFWFGAGPDADTDMPPDIQAKLERYRVPVIG